MKNNDSILLETQLGPGEESTLAQARALELESAAGYRIIIEADMGVRLNVVSCGPLVLELYASDDRKVWEKTPCIQYKIGFRRIKGAWKAKSMTETAPLHNFVKPVVRNAPANHRVAVKVTARTG